MKNINLNGEDIIIHYFVWNDGQLNFLHKFQVVEHMKINQEDYILELLKDKYHWNT